MGYPKIELVEIIYTLENAKKDLEVFFDGEHISMALSYIEDAITEINESDIMNK